MKLIKYEEIDYFVEEYAKIKNKLDIKKRITDIENARWAQSSSHKKGAQAYQQQKLNWLDTIKEAAEDIKETVFMRLKKKRKTVVKQLTVFEKMRLKRDK